MRHRRASSIDLYREHLLNQLGRSGWWQTSLQLREEVAPLSFEVEGETSFGIKNRISNSRPILVCPPGLFVHSSPDVVPIGWLAQQGMFSACLFVVLLSKTGLSEKPALVC